MLFETQLCPNCAQPRVRGVRPAHVTAMSSNSGAVCFEGCRGEPGTLAAEVPLFPSEEETLRVGTDLVMLGAGGAVGGIAYLSHLVALGADIRSKREKVRDLAEAGISQSEGLRTWASKHGVQTPHGQQHEDSGG